MSLDGGEMLLRSSDILAEERPGEGRLELAARLIAAVKSERRAFRANTDSEDAQAGARARETREAWLSELVATRRGRS